ARGSRPRRARAPTAQRMLGTSLASPDRGTSSAHDGGRLPNAADPGLPSAIEIVGRRAGSREGNAERVLGVAQVDQVPGAVLGRQLTAAATGETALQRIAHRSSVPVERRREWAAARELLTFGGGHRDRRRRGCPV